MTIACSHPGKHGDALYALPTIRALCAKHNTKADFYTSEYCEPLRTLFQAQDCIANFYVAPNYRVERMDCGVQPFYVPIDTNCYTHVAHLGFRNVPNCAIPDYIARQAGVRPYPIRYDTPEAQKWWDDVRPDQYLVISPRASEDYAPLFRKIIRQSSIPVVGVGGEGDLRLLGAEFPPLPRRGKLWYENGLSYLETAYILKHAKAFIGLMSSQLCLANGFPIPRIAPHDGHSWDMRHPVRSPLNFYPVKPSADEVFEIIEKGVSVKSSAVCYSKTADESDYETSDLFQHIQNMTGVLAGCFTPWGTPYRKWEYGTCLKALRENDAHTVLEVGGGSSLFAASAIWAGLDVTVVEPEDYMSMFAEQSRRIGIGIPVVKANFFDYPEGKLYDAVTCISVIEHVPDDAAFFAKLLRFVKPGGLLCLTTDFSPSGKALFGGHVRTYNSAMLKGLASFAEFGDNGKFEVFGAAPDYSHFEQNVHGMYSFASLVLKRVK